MSAPTQTVRQHELESLAQGLEPEPETLAALLEDPDPGVVHAALLYMRQHDSPDPSRRRAWAALLPREVGRYSPEVQVLLAELYLKLCLWHPTRSLPDWRSTDLLPAVELAWWRAQLLIHPETLQVVGAVQEQHYQALAGLTAATVPYPEELLHHLAHRDEEHFQLLAESLLRDCLSSGVVTAAFAQGILRALCQSRHVLVVERALARFGEPWALCGECPTDLLRHALAADEEAIVSQAIQTLAAWRQADLLEQILRDSARPGRQRRDAMARLGDIAGRGPLTAVLSLAASDVLLYGEACLACLSAYHHRGFFIRPEHLTDLLTVYTGCYKALPEVVARLAYTCREELVEELACRPPDDPRWERWLALLTRIPSDSVQPLLLNLLGVPRREVRLAVIEALAAVGCLRAEEPLLGLLEIEPAACLQALRSLGGKRTADRLRELLGVGAPERGIAPALRVDRDQALSLLWHLTHQGSEERRLLLRWLTPADLPKDVRKDLGVHVQPEEIDLLIRADLRAHACLQALCDLGSSEVLPLVADLLMRHVSELNAGIVCNEAERGEARSFIFQPVKTAIRRLGERLQACGKIRPRCLLGTVGSGAGAALLADLVFDLMETRDPAPGELAILLEALDGLPCPPQRLQRLLRRKEPSLRKVVIRLLGQQQAIGLAYNLGVLAGEEDIETIRPALAALGNLRATWAVERVCDCLDHPNMNIKKTAAEALRTAGTVQAVPKILYWLGHDDNPGFRQALLTALETLLGSSCLATLLAALEQAREPRQQELLVLALDKKLTLFAVRRAASSQAPYADLLLSALHQRRIELAAGSLADLTAELALFGISVPASMRAAPADPGEGPSSEIAQIMANGWNEALVLRVLRQEPSEHTRWVVRHYLREWLNLLDHADATARHTAWRMLLDVNPPQWSLAEISLLTARLESLLTAFDSADRSQTAGFLRLLAVLLPHCSRPVAARIAMFLRALPRLSIEEGKTRFQLLRACGVLRTRADLRRALDDGLDEVQDILTEAFHLAGSHLPPEARQAQAALEAALGAPEANEWTRLRANWPWPSHVTLHLLALALPRSAPAHQDAILDWMLSLQPLDVPAWTLAEDAHNQQQARHKRAARHRASPFEQPASEALRNELRTLLAAEDPQTRRRAVATLLSWPEATSEHQLVLTLYLEGTIELDAAGRRFLARLLADREPSAALGEGAWARWLDLCQYVEDLSGCMPWLLRLWESNPSVLAARAQWLLQRIPAERLMPAVIAGVDRHRLAYVDLLKGPVLHTPEVQRILEKLDAAGDQRRAENLRKLVVAGCLRAPADDRALEELRARLVPPDATGNRALLLAAARGNDPEQIRSALKELVHQPDAEVIELFKDLTRHRRPRVRSLALRCLRRTADRDTYLQAACGSLHDPRAEVQRSAIRAVTHARYRPAIGPIVDLLLHTRPEVREAATEGLPLYGKLALSALTYALRHARPDRRDVYQRIIAGITETLSQDPPAPSSPEVP